MSSSGNSTTFLPPLIGKRNHGRRAFTLVELMVVMAIIVTLLGISILGFKNLLGGRGVESSINSVTGILELSRSTAISNRTYVWTLFKNVVNSDNNCELKCLAVASRSGLNNWGPSNLRPITKVITVTGVKNVKFTQMPSNLQQITPSELASDGSFFVGWYNTDQTNSGFAGDGSGSTPPPYIIGGENFAGAPFVGFLRDGEVGTSSKQDPYGLMVEPKISLGLIGTRGPNIQPNATDGAIIAYYGGSGRIRVIRP